LRNTCFAGYAEYPWRGLGMKRDKEISWGGGRGGGDEERKRGGGMRKFCHALR